MSKMIQNKNRSLMGCEKCHILHTYVALSPAEIEKNRILGIFKEEKLRYNRLGCFE